MDDTDWTVGTDTPNPCASYSIAWHLRLCTRLRFVESNLRISLLPLPEQRRIVAYLDSLPAKVNELRRLQAQTSAELDALLSAVLDRAFKDEL